MDIDIEIPRFADDDNVLPGAEPFPVMAATGRTLQTSLSEAQQEHVSSESAEAPLPRKARVPKQLPVDARQELHNADLARWKADYANNMAEAIEAKKNHKAPTLAKKNAAFWVVGAGIGGVGAGLGTSKLKSPLDMFAGDSMMEALTGVKTWAAGLKRSRDRDIDHDFDSDARRVRTRDGDVDQIRRGEGIALEDDDGTMMISAGEVIHEHSSAQLSLTCYRESRSAGMPKHHSKMLLFHGMSVRRSDLGKDLSYVGAVLRAVLGASLPVLAGRVLYPALEVSDPAL